MLHRMMVARTITLFKFCDMLLVPQNLFMHKMNFEKQVNIYVSKDVHFKPVSINISAKVRNTLKLFAYTLYTYINHIDGILR